MLGLTTTPSQEFYDLVVIGGGPAGLAAAVYGASEGLQTVLIEQHRDRRAGGPSSRIENYLGFPDGVSGSQLADAARRQAEKFGAELITARKAVGARSQRIGAHRDGSTTAAPSARTRSSWPPASPTASCRPRAATTLTGCGIYYGAAVSVAVGVRGRRGLRVRRRQLGRPGRDVPVPDRQVGHTSSCAAPSLEASMSLLPDPADRGEPQDQRPHLHRGACAPAATATWTELTLVEQPDRGERGSRLRPDVHLHRRRPAHRLARRRPSPATTTASSWPDPDLHDVCGWTLDRPPHHLETSVPGVFVAGDVRSSPPSGSRPPSAKDRWP